MTRVGLVQRGLWVALVAGGGIGCSTEMAEFTDDASVAVSAAALTSSPDTNCTSAVNAGREYWFCNTERSWSVARQKCQAVGLDLASIETSTENTFVRSHVPDDSWIGANDQTAEGVWRWVASGTQFWQGSSSGSAFGGAYTNWASLQPNNAGDQDCAIIDDASSAKWSDESCSGSREYVCEGPSDQCPNDPNKTSPGQCGCGVADTDSDADGTANCNDGCPNNAGKVALGQCGCAVADTDSDGDGTANCNDGCPNDAAHIAPDCAPDSGCSRVVFGPSAYWFCNTHRNWATARSKCEAAGYQFARVNDAVENAFIDQHIGSDYWVGGSDLGTEGSWIWEQFDDSFWQGDHNGTATPGVYTNWDFGEPSTLGSHDCLQVYGNGEWNADDCGDTEQYICEDLCPTDTAKSLPGICGCGTSDIDSNNDGSADCVATAGHNLFGPTFDLWKDLGWEHSEFGLPITDTLLMSDGVGYYTQFDDGMIYWHPDTGAHVVSGPIGRRWLQLGGADALGYPIADEEEPYGDSEPVCDDDELAGMQSMALAPAAATAVGPGGIPINLPDDFPGVVLRFQSGSIYWSRFTGAWWVSGTILGRFEGWVRELGFPTSPERIAPDDIGHFQHFQYGSIYSHPEHGTRVVWGSVYERWASLGWERGSLGYPITDVVVLHSGFGDWFVGQFEHDAIWWSECEGITFDAPDCNSGVPGSGCQSDDDCLAPSTCAKPWGTFSSWGRCTRSMETLCPDPPEPDAPEDCFPGSERGYVADSSGDQFNRCVDGSVLATIHDLKFHPATTIEYDAKADKSLPPDGNTVPEWNVHHDHIQGLGRISGLGAEHWFAASISNINADEHNGHPSGVLFLDLHQVKGRDGEAFHSGAEYDRDLNKATAYYKIDTAHAGGIQVAGRTLAVAASNDSRIDAEEEASGEYGTLPKESVAFYDVSDPKHVSEADALLNKLIFSDLYYPPGLDVPSEEPLYPFRPSSAGFVKLESGGFLLAVTNHTNSGTAQVWLFVTPYYHIGPDTRWYFHNFVEVDTAVGGENLSFVTECNGTVYLLMTGNNDFDAADTNRSDENRIEAFTLVRASNKFRLDPAPGRAGFQDGFADFKAAANFYVSPSGNLLLYANNRRGILENQNSKMAEFSLCETVWVPDPPIGGHPSGKWLCVE